MFRNMLGIDNIYVEIISLLVLILIVMIMGHRNKVKNMSKLDIDDIVSDFECPDINIGKPYYKETKIEAGDNGYHTSLGLDGVKIIPNKYKDYTMSDLFVATLNEEYIGPNDVSITLMDKNNTVVTAKVTSLADSKLTKDTEISNITLFVHYDGKEYSVLDVLDDVNISYDDRKLLISLDTSDNSDESFITDVQNHDTVPDNPNVTPDGYAKHSKVRKDIVVEMNSIDDTFKRLEI